MLKTNPLKVVVVAALVILLLLTVSMDITAEDVTVRTISADDVQTVDTDDIRLIRAEESEDSATNKQDQVSTKLLDDARYSWARDDIEELASQGAVIGYPDGTFKPNQAISRAEFAAMLCRALDLEKADDAPDMPYTDLADHWAAEYVDALYSHELLSVMDGETFDPDAEVTRSEIVSTLMGIIDIQERFGNPLDNVDASFIDLTSGDSLFAEVEAAERLGIIPIHFGVAFEPNRPVTRAEAASMVNRLINVDVVQGMITNADQYGNITVVGENASESQISVSTDTLTVRNGLAARPNTLRQGDMVYVVARDNNAKFVHSFGEITQEDLITRVTGALKGVLTQEEVAALVRGDYDTVRESVGPKLKDRLMDEGLSESEAEALISQNWDQIPSLLQERAISTISKQLGVPSEVVMDTVQQNWDSLRSYAEQKLTEFALAALMESEIVSSNDPDQAAGGSADTKSGTANG